MLSITVTGEVDQKERGQIMAPGLVKPSEKGFTYVPILRLRLIMPAGDLKQILYKGDPPGDADIGEQVEINGISRGGVIHARTIYNLSTDSWVTPPPNYFQRLLNNFF